MLEHSHNTSMQPHETITKQATSRPVRPAAPAPTVQIRKIVGDKLSCDACSKRDPIHKVCQKHFEELR